MLEILKEIILDAQDETFFTGTPRQLSVNTVAGKATIIMGVRRCGKSTYLNQIVRKLLSDGISNKNILYINFFDDRLANLKEVGLDLVLKAYYLLYPHKKGTETVYCFFDEIQYIPGWEAFIERLLRTEDCMVYLSGSSADMLSKEIATQMRGRGISWELFPFSFFEFTNHLQLNNVLPFNSQQRLLIENAYLQYVECGGFPEVISFDKNLRRKIHQEYFHSILFRDLIERYDISHPKAVVDLSRRLIDNVGSMYTTNSLTEFLKSLGHSVPKASVVDYLKWFEDAYFLFSLRMYDASYRRSNANPKKCYCIDHALIRSVSSGILVNSGHILENIVFMSLRRSFTEIFYYKTSNGQEVDFLIKTDKGEIRLFQVCETLVNPVTRQRETTALQNAMSELGLSEGTIITKDEEDTLSAKSGKIKVLPAWRFLLYRD